MHKLIIVGTVLAYVQGHGHPVNQQMIDTIKAQATTWYPMELEDNPLHHLSISAVQGLLGTVFDADVAETASLVADSGATVPTSFDART